MYVVATHTLAKITMDCIMYYLKVMSKYESKRPLDQSQIPEINRDLSMECGLAKLSIFHEKILSGDNRAKLTVREP